MMILGQSTFKHSSRSPIIMLNAYIWFRHQESGKPQVSVRYGPEACALPNYTTRCLVMLWVLWIPPYNTSRPQVSLRPRNKSQTQN